MRSRNRLSIRVNSMVSLALLVLIGIVVTTEARAGGSWEIPGLDTRTDVTDKASASIGGFGLRRLVPRSYHHSLQDGAYDLQLQGVGARYGRGNRRLDGGLDIGFKVGMPDNDRTGKDVSAPLYAPDLNLRQPTPAKGPFFMFSIGKHF